MKKINMKKLIKQTPLLPNFSTSTLPTRSSLHPRFISGFADAESSFIISITKNSQLKTG
jgi:hypothetical protein